MDKKSFLLYKDIKVVLDHLSDDEAGKLIKLIVSYVNCEKPNIDDHPLKLAFLPIKQQLKRDLKKYETQCTQNSTNAKKRWDKPHATACDRMPNDAKHADTDSGNDIDTVNDTDIDKEKLVKKVVYLFKNEWVGHIKTKLDAENIVMSRVSEFKNSGFNILEGIRWISKDSFDNELQNVLIKIDNLVSDNIKKTSARKKMTYVDGEGKTRDEFHKIIG